MAVEGLLDNPAVCKFVDWVANKGSRLHRYHDDQEAAMISSAS
jgi:hypothetical protein